MPISPASLCLDCSKRALAGSKYCADHQTDNRAAAYKKEFDRYRENDPIRKLYRCNRWIKGTRLRVLRRDPLCCECGHKASTVADHYPLSAREIVSQFGVKEFYNADRCRGLCKPCHDASTAVREGFARKKPA